MAIIMRGSRRGSAPIVTDQDRENAARAVMTSVNGAPLLLQRCELDRLERSKMLPAWVLERLEEFRSDPSLLYRALWDQHLARLANR